MRIAPWSLLLGLAASACLGQPPAAPVASPATSAPGTEPVDDGLGPIVDAPWRGRRSEAEGEEPDTSGAPAVMLRGARLLVGDGTEIAAGHVLLGGGKIVSVGSGPGEAPAGATVIDAAGKTITPGLIDAHSHLGVYASPGVIAHADGNEAAAPSTAAARAIDALWPFDPSIERAVAGGTTTVQVLPGSANLVGGIGVTVKLRPATSPRAMHLRGAPDGLKMACGENPKRVYGERNQAPASRMGNLALQRQRLLEARRLIREWDSWRLSERLRRDKYAVKVREVRARRAERARQQRDCGVGRVPPDRCRSWEDDWRLSPISDPDPLEPQLPPKRDLELETLAAALEGWLPVHVHCYRSDDMAAMMALGNEVGLTIRTFEHALEAYKIRERLAARHIGVSTWADWWGFKMEAYDGIPENLALVHAAGGTAIVHSDSAEGVRRLNQEASKGMWAGRHAGLAVSEANAIRWVTSNPAWALDIERQVGTLAVGKDADVVVWEQSPFSVYGRATLVFIDGVVRYDARRPGRRWSDFEATNE